MHKALIFVCLYMLLFGNLVDCTECFSGCTLVLGFGDGGFMFRMTLLYEL